MSGSPRNNSPAGCLPLTPSLSPQAGRGRVAAASGNLCTGSNGTFGSGSLSPLAERRTGREAVVPPVACRAKSARRAGGGLAWRGARGRSRVEQLVGHALLVRREGRVKRFERRHQP